MAALCLFGLHIQTANAYGSDYDMHLGLPLQLSLFVMAKQQQFSVDTFNYGVYKVYTYSSITVFVMYLWNLLVENLSAVAHLQELAVIFLSSVSEVHAHTYTRAHGSTRNSSTFYLLCCMYLQQPMVTISSFGKSLQMGVHTQPISS